MDPPSAKAAELLANYSDAPVSMPDHARALAERELGGVVIFYGLSDLDSDLKFRSVWVALGRDALVLIRESDGSQSASLLLRIPRHEIAGIRTDSGLSCFTTSFLSAEDGAALATVRYTRRQHATFEGLRAAIEHRGDQPSPAENDPAFADAAYRESVAGPLLSVQPGVASSGVQVLRRLLRYLAPYRKQVTVGLAAAALVALIGLAPPYLSGQLLDTVIEGGTGAGFLRGAWVIVGTITAAVFIRAIFLWLRLHLMAILGEKVARDLRRDVYGHVQKLSVGYFSKSQTGTVVSRVGSDTDRIWELITFGLAEAILSGFTLLAIGTVLLILDWRLGIVMLAPLPLLIMSVVRNGQGMQAGFTKAWRRWASLNAVIADTIPGIRVVKAFAQEDRERGRFNRENEAVFNTFNEVHARWTRFWPVLLLALHGIGLAVYWVALPRLGGSGISLTPGTFVTFLLFSWMFVQPVESLAQMGRMVSRSLSSARRVFEIMDTVPETPPTKGVVGPGIVRGEVEFEDVWFGYKKFRPVLRGVSFKAAPGELVGIVGRSGVGKSSLIQLIPRFFSPDAGRILLDGNDLRKLDIESVRKQIGIVDQDPFLFHGSILENIRYGKPNSTPAEIIAAARIADCHGFICGLPLGYETVVGERGHTLSGGERQRISLARALISKPRILIFDEATSSVDGESEARVHAALREATSGTTTFVIAHRLAALRHADRILVLEDGVIVAEGTCQELLDSDDTFRQLFSNQVGIPAAEEKPS